MVWLLGAMVWTACLDDPGGPETPQPPAGLVVSDPVAAGAARVALGASFTVADEEGSVVYVSLVPGTEPRGVTATVRALTSDSTLTTAVRDGGFDPVPLVAQVGDTIEVIVRDASGDVVLPARIAVARVGRPIVVRTDPPPKKRDVPLNSVMVVVFSEPIDAATLTSATLQVQLGTTPISGQLSLIGPENLTAAFVPDAPLTPGTDYQLVVTQGVRDLDGQSLEAAVTAEFTTAIGAVAALEFMSVAAGGYFLVPPVGPPGTLGHTCALTTSRTAYCWGSNANGRLGTSTPSSVVPVAVSGELTFSSLTVGTWHTCGLTSDGAAYCWGNGLQLGNGSMTSRFGPEAVAGGLTFSVLSAAFQHTCGLTMTGAAYCWGLNYVGQLGDGTTSSNASGTAPVAVTGGLTFASLSASGDHTCALARDGVAYCWGANSFGQLGDGTTNFSSGPVAVSGGLTFTTLSTSTAHTCGVTLGGAAYCWGWNGSGQLGDGTTTSSSVPVAVAGGLAFSMLAPGSAPARGGHFPMSTHTCGATNSGAAYCWGQNGYGQLGTGSTESSTVPVAVSGGLTFSTLSASGVHTCGVATNGETYCWGSNSSGQLGIGTTNDSNRPVKVVGQP